MIVLDASVAVEWLLDDGPRSLSDDVFQAMLEEKILVPSHWPLEVSNVLRPGLRDRKISTADFHIIMARLDQIDIVVQPPIEFDEIGPLTDFSVAHQLTSYDGAYVQLALQQGATLATFDKAMRSAATRLNIPLLPA